MSRPTGRAASDARPDPLAQAQALLATGQYALAEQILTPLTLASPPVAAAHKLLAMLAVTQQRVNDAMHHAGLAASLSPADADVFFTLGRAQKLALRLHEAIAAYRLAVALQPRHGQALVSLGIALRESGDLHGAIAAYQQAITADAKLGVAHSNLAHAMAQRAERSATALPDGEPSAEMLASTERAVVLDPHNAGLLRNHGGMLQRARRYAEAAEFFNRALGVRPADLDCCLALGECLLAAGQPGNAIAVYEKWLSGHPPSAAVMRALSGLHTVEGHVAEGLKWAERAVALEPEAGGQLLLANAYQQCRRLDDALAASQRALDMSDHALGFYPLHLLCMSYLHEEPQTIFDRHADFGRRLAASMAPVAAALRHPLKPAAAQSTRPMRPMRQTRLKVGYVSGDFVQHSVSYFISGLLAGHDRARFEITLYSNRSWGDAVTERLKALGHGWVDCEGVSDGTLADLMRAEGIDVLIDLAGHTSKSRVELFALRAAPVQISYLGYPTVTGVAEMDFRITDTVIDPGDMPALASDTPLHLPRSMFCYQPDAAPPIDPAPLLRNGHVTFGSFNNVAKLSDRTLALWVRLLQQVPGARLMLKSASMAETVTRDNITHFMQAHGIAPERLLLLARLPSKTSHLSLYNSIDIALDPFPYNGATTTCEALWMGVPVVTLRGRTHTSRMGASILAAAGHAEWVASDETTFIGIAAALAADPARLTAWRQCARATLQASTLLDSAGFTNCFEQALDLAWQRVSQTQTQFLK